MTYDVHEQRVRWKGRAIRQADAATFEPIGGSLARDASAVFFAGKVVEADVTTFELLSGTHAKDSSRVWQILASKLKPMPKADAATFVAVGSRYGRDSAKVWYGSKAVRLKKRAGVRADEQIAAFRQLAEPFATDGAGLYFGAQQLDGPDLDGPERAEGTRAPLDWSRACVVARSFNEVNVTDLVLSDGQSVYVRDSVRGWLAAEALDPDTASWVNDGTLGGVRARYIRDADALYFDGQRVTELAGHAPALVGETIARVGNATFVGAERRPELDEPSIVWLRDDLVSLPQGVARVDAASSAANESYERPSAAGVAVAMRALMGVALPAVRAVRSNHLPVEAIPYECSLEGDFAGGMDDWSLASEGGGQLALRSDYGTLLAPASNWFDVLSMVCAAEPQADRPMGAVLSARTAFVNYSTSYPGIDAIEQRICSAFPREVADLAAALFEAGEAEEALLVAHQLLTRAGRTETDILRRIPHGLAHAARYDELKWQIDRTTNFGVVKLLAADAALDDDDARRRWERIELMASAVTACNKADRAVPLAVDALLRRDRAETSAILRRAIRVGLEMCCTSATVAADMQRTAPYAALRDAAEALMEAEVDVALQRTRLVEACYGLGDASAADAHERALLDLEGARQLPLAGPYVYRARYRGAASACLGARARALPSRSGELDPAELASARQGLVGQLDAMERARAGDTEEERFDLSSIRRSLEDSCP